MKKWSLVIVALFFTLANGLLISTPARGGAYSQKGPLIQLCYGYIPTCTEAAWDACGDYCANKGGCSNVVYANDWCCATNYCCISYWLYCGDGSHTYWVCQQWNEACTKPQR
jgi:hypothetical protein